MASSSGGKTDGGKAMLSQLRAMIEREFTPEQLADLRKRMDQTMEQAETLRETPLENADEPEIVFQPYRTEKRGN